MVLNHGLNDLGKALLTIFFWQAAGAGTKMPPSVVVGQQTPHVDAAATVHDTMPQLHDDLGILIEYFDIGDGAREEGID